MAVSLASPLNRVYTLCRLVRKSLRHRAASTAEVRQHYSVGTWGWGGSLAKRTFLLCLHSSRKNTDTKILTSVQTQLKPLAMVIYPAPTCNAWLEQLWALNSSYCIRLCYCLTDQRASFTHFLLCNVIHQPKTFSLINKYCNNTPRVTGKKCWCSTGQCMWNTPVLLSRAFHTAPCLMSPSPGLMTCQSFRNTLPSSSMIHRQP